MDQCLDLIQAHSPFFAIRYWSEESKKAGEGQALQKIHSTHQNANEPEQSHDGFHPTYAEQFQQKAGH
jgi:hypothetical protein